MLLLRLISTLVLALILVQGSVVEAVARSEMQAAPGFEICGQGHEAGLGGLPGGKGHPCQHCLAAAATADLGGPWPCRNPVCAGPSGWPRSSPFFTHGSISAPPWPEARPFRFEPFPKFNLTGPIMTLFSKLTAGMAVSLGLAMPAQAHNGVHVHDPFARIIAGSGAVYFLLENMEDQRDTLLSASSPDAGMVMLMNSSEDANGVMQMRDMPEGFAVEPGETRLLKGAGDHIMLMDMKRKVKNGDKVTLFLTFERAGALTLVVPVNNARSSESTLEPTEFDAMTAEVE